MKSKILALVAASMLLVASAQQSSAAPLVVTTGTFKVPVFVQGVMIGTFVCATGIIAAALLKNLQQNKPLTATEAMGCGFTAFRP